MASWPGANLDRLTRTSSSRSPLSHPHHHAPRRPSPSPQRVHFTTCPSPNLVVTYARRIRTLHPAVSPSPQHTTPSIPCSVHTEAAEQPSRIFAVKTKPLCSRHGLHDATRIPIPIHPPRPSQPGKSPAPTDQSIRPTAGAAPRGHGPAVSVTAAAPGRWRRIPSKAKAYALVRTVRAGGRRASERRRFISGARN